MSGHPLGFFGCIVGAVLLAAIFIKAKVTKRINDRIAIVLPGIGGIVREINVARTASHCALFKVALFRRGD